MCPNWITVLLSFLGGSVAAWIISFLVSKFMRPIIRARLVAHKGCYVTAHIGNPPTRQAKFLRLMIENTGRSAIKDCSGYITHIIKSEGGKTVGTQEEVLELGWSHRSTAPRSIPRGAFFYMDIVSLDFAPERNALLPAFAIPNSMQNFFNDKGTYQFAVMVAADNAVPDKRRVSFDYDPARADLVFSYDTDV